MRAWVALSVVVALVAAHRALPATAGQEAPRTLREALQRAGFPIPIDLAPADLDRVSSDSRWDHDDESFVVGTYFPEERELRLVRVSKLGKVNRHQWPDGKGVGQGGFQNIEIAPPYTLVHARVSPSAGFTHVLDANLTLLASLFALSSDVLADGTILFEGGMVHFADEHHQTLGAFNPVTKRVIEVFPGKLKSPYGALVEQRSKDILARIERERGVELADGEKVIGFDRYIEAKKIAPNRRAVAFTVSYGNLKVLWVHRKLQSNSSLRNENDPPWPAYPISTIVRCARNATNVWMCRERLLDDAAKSYRITLPIDPPARRDAAIATILEREIAGR